MNARYKRSVVIALVSVNAHGLATGVFVAMVVQFVMDGPVLDCSVTRKYGVVPRTTVALVAVLEMLANSGGVGFGSWPISPLNVTPAENDNALPSIVLVVFITMP